MASYTGNQPFTTYPRIPGHEFSAQIISIPENDRGLKPGDIITANPYFNCGGCYFCKRGFVNCCTDNQTMGVQRDGAFREYITMPVERIYEGKGLSVKAQGARVYVADILQGRLEKALHFGADGVINSKDSDIVEETSTMTDITYKSAVRFIAETPKMTEAEKDAFLGGNAVRFYGLSALTPIPERKNML